MVNANYPVGMPQFPAYPQATMAPMAMPAYPQQQPMQPLQFGDSFKKASQPTRRNFLAALAGLGVMAAALKPQHAIAETEVPGDDEEPSDPTGGFLGGNGQTNGNGHVNGGPGNSQGHSQGHRGGGPGNSANAPGHRK